MDGAAARALDCRPEECRPIDRRPMDDVALLLLAVLAAAAALAPALRAARAPAPDGAADWRDDDAALEREIGRASCRERV